MVTQQGLTSCNTFLVVGGLFVIFVAANELGFRVGRKLATFRPPRENAQIQAIEAAILTLFGLLLAFTYSMAATRYDLRKQTLVEESNAIGTAYLRASLLPPSGEKEVKQLLRRYVDLRLSFYLGSAGSSALVAVNEETAQLHQRLWNVAAKEGRKNPVVTIGLLLSALNEVIDLCEKQAVAFENRIPETIVIFLFLLSIVAVSVVGYLNGLGLHRQTTLTLIFSGVIAMTVFLVLDLERPRRGFIWLSHESLIRLQESLKKDGN